MVSFGTECFRQSRIFVIRTIGGTARRTGSYSRAKPASYCTTPLFNSSLLLRHWCEKLPLSIFKATHQLPGGNNRTCPIDQPHRVPPVGDLTSIMLPRQQRGDIYQLLRKTNAYNQAAGVKTGRVDIAWEDLEVFGVAGEDSKVYWPSFPSSFPPLSDHSEQ